MICGTLGRHGRVGTFDVLTLKVLKIKSVVEPRLHGTQEATTDLGGLLSELHGIMLLEVNRVTLLRNNSISPDHNTQDVPTLNVLKIKSVVEPRLCGTQEATTDLFNLVILMWLASGLVFHTSSGLLPEL